MIYKRAQWSAEA